jgi:hypothetical protein
MQLRAAVQVLGPKNVFSPLVRGPARRAVAASARPDVPSLGTVKFRSAAARPSVHRSLRYLARRLPVVVPRCPPNFKRIDAGTPKFVHSSRQPQPAVFKTTATPSKFRFRNSGRKATPAGCLTWAEPPKLPARPAGPSPGLSILQDNRNPQSSRQPQPPRNCILQDNRNPQSSRQPQPPRNFLSPFPRQPQPRGAPSLANAGSIHVGATSVGAVWVTSAFRATRRRTRFGNVPCDHRARRLHRVPCSKNFG